MTVFGRTLSEYVAFQKGILIAVAVVGVLKLALSLAGVPDSATRWVSMTALSVLAALYYGVAVHTKGFGSYRQLLPLLVVQSAVAHGIVIAGILISAMTGRANIFTADEYGGNTPAALHIGAHVVGGVIVGPLIAWLVASIVMFVAKRVTRAPRPTPAAA